MLEIAVSTGLTRAAQRLSARMDELGKRLDAGDTTVWTEYSTTAAALATIAPQIRPEARGALLTTGQLAERLASSPKTLLKRKARGEIRPALQRGRLIRWRGDERMA